MIKASLDVLVLLVSVGPVDFDSEVLPILSRAGCNAAACHGAASGRGGLKLSLFAGDPAADHRELTLALEGRRINWRSPRQSLLILKPTEQLDHGGGQRLDPDGAWTRQLVAWIAEGALRRGANPVLQLEASVTPDRFQQAGQRGTLRVVAQFDGERRDVTDLAIVEPADPAAVEIQGRDVRVIRRGRHVLAVRFMNQVRTVHLTAPLNAAAADPAALRAQRRNWIDDELGELLEQLRIPVSPPADDSRILRRVSLDLTGRLPTESEARDYLADREPQKYSRLLDRLLASDAFVEYWTYRLSIQLRAHPLGGELQGVEAFHQWLAAQLAEGAGWDAITRKMLLATGDSHSVGPANFQRVGGGAREQAEYFSESLMGVRLRCANCHNHPLDRWTQDDYHGLAAIFARVDRRRVVALLADGEVTHPRTGAAATPSLPGGASVAREAADPRVPLADWLLQPENPYFAANMVNRLWSALLGRGLVEPLDNLSQTNPATHPALLARLAEHFRERGCDLRATLREIALSGAYRRSAAALQDNAADDRYYSHARPKPLAPEVLLDAFDDVLGVRETYGDAPPGVRAVALVNPQLPSESLDLLGRCPRDGACVEPNSLPGGVRARLHLINGAVINRKLADPRGLPARLAASSAAPESLLEQLFLRTLARMPSADERTLWTPRLTVDDRDELRARLEDLLWSLLNCQEFVTSG